MKLNSDIIFDNLKKFIPLEMYGSKITDLRLERPEFHVGSNKSFLANHLYIAKADRLPQSPTIERGVVIICIGNNLHLANYHEKCCMIRAKDDENILFVFNLVQDIFNKYDAWNEKLGEILNGNASVKEMVEFSSTIFETPIFVIDANFHFLAYSGYSEPIIDNKAGVDSRPDANNNLRLPVLGQFLELHEPSMSERDPQLLNLLDSSTLNINLFENDEYIGCLTIDYRNRPHQDSDIPLGKFLAKMITLSLRKYSSILTNGKSVLKQVLQDVIDGLPVDAEQRRALESANLNKEYACVKLKFGNRFAQLPIGYVCNMVENSFPKSIAFEYDHSIIGFIETSSIHESDGSYSNTLREFIKTFIQSMDMRVGVSDPFNDLYKARLYYRQACIALEKGSLIHFTKRYYTFQEYALIELVVNSLGELPVELFFSEGVRRLAEHDASSQVSYLETLRVYLNQNMSITKTAAALYIHRSTLLERLTRIERDLNIILNDSDERLRLHILLKAIQIHEMIQGKIDGNLLK